MNSYRSFGFKLSKCYLKKLKEKSPLLLMGVFTDTEHDTCSPAKNCLSSNHYLHFGCELDKPVENTKIKNLCWWFGWWPSAKGGWEDLLDTAPRHQGWNGYSLKMIFKEKPLDFENHKFEKNSEKRYIRKCYKDSFFSSFPPHKTSTLSFQNL